MQNLNKLIQRYGRPDALIDYWDKSSNRYAIWGFDSTFVVNSNGQAIINGEEINEDPLVAFQKILNKWKLSQNDLSAVGYISYDFKNILFPHIKFKKLRTNNPLMWFAKPKLLRSYKINDLKTNSSPHLYIRKDLTNIINYEQNIKKIKTYLMNGDSYQINFTQPKLYRTNLDALD